MTDQRALVVGIGNPVRGDDRAGIEVIRRLRARLLGSWDVIETDGDPTKLMDMWEAYDKVIAVDAIVTGKAPLGSIFRWDVSTQALPSDYRSSSSHSLGLSEAIELARVFSKLPKQIEVIGIESSSFGYCEEMSPDVERAVDDVVVQISKAERGGEWMHEYSLINSLMIQIYTVASVHKAKRIVSLTVRLGALLHMSSDHFLEHFVEAAKGGMAEGARLEVVLDDDQESPSAQDVLLERIEVED